ncbi:olfactomedin-like protein 2B [Pteropus alecto]|uniref:olfactomedin-like protein 2B n=1 Tax=Pteropus alecto TaxID=9402 RepID=UPI000D535151|nr:olfactomedin-like protein 2B [Pteropus alecto]
MAWLLPLVLCLALGVAPGCVSRVAPAGTSEPPGAQTGAPAEDETLQNEADNQENVLSQLLGDYDKVKAVAEGSDCQCRCVVRPLGRDACQRAAEGTARKEDVYTVETITSGSSCKCACVAPPSALNPCEGDFRLQKLREADSRDLKLSTVIDMLEGALYGLDLLKLHSVTTRLVGRVDKLEEEVSRNLTKENKQIRDDVEGIRTEMNKRDREKCSRDVPERGPDARSAVQLDAALGPWGLGTWEDGGQAGTDRGARPRPKPAPGQKLCTRTAGNSLASPMMTTSMLLGNPPRVPPEEQYEERFLREETVSQQVNAIELLQTRPLAPPEARRPQRPLQRRVLLRERDPQPTPSACGPRTGSPALRPPPASAPCTLCPTGTASPSPAPGADEDDIRNVIGRCKDTLSTITGPTTQNTYGRNEGAWMKDPLAKDERIYVTNYYYGNTLMEFRNLESFKQGRWSNSYKLPYSWVGTGHVVYGGALYYSRAFTRNIIKYDLRLRFVAAWALLHDVAYAEATPWSWHGHSDVDFAVDENGLWLIYPALDDGGSSQEVIVLSKLDAADLSTRKETTWRTGLRRHVFGNCFVICGVLYAVDSRSQRNANISYAFDTHTNTQTVPRLLFENEYAYTTQVDYNPKDRLLYAWDNGHQVTYHVIFAY